MSVFIARNCDKVSGLDHAISDEIFGDGLFTVPLLQLVADFEMKMSQCYGWSACLEAFFQEMDDLTQKCTNVTDTPHHID
jgi:hypothetical protein